MSFVLFLCLLKKIYIYIYLYLLESCHEPLYLDVSWKWRTNWLSATSVVVTAQSASYQTINHWNQSCSVYGPLAKPALSSHHLGANQWFKHAGPFSQPCCFNLRFLFNKTSSCERVLAVTRVSATFPGRKRPSEIWLNGTCLLAISRRPAPAPYCSSVKLVPLGSCRAFCSHCDLKLW